MRIYEKLNLNSLKRMSKVYKISNCSKMRKKDLLKLIVESSSCIKIQRMYRRKLINNSLCPISLEKIKCNTPCYGHKIGKKFIYYNLETLVDNIFVSGVFKDPISRVEYTDDQLKCIDTLCKTWKLKTKMYIISREVVLRRGILLDLLNLSGHIGHFLKQKKPSTGRF